MHREELHTMKTNKKNVKGMLCTNSVVHWPRSGGREDGKSIVGHPSMPASKHTKSRCVTAGARVGFGGLPLSANVPTGIQPLRQTSSETSEGRVSR